MVRTLAVASIANPSPPRNRAGTRLTSIPKANVAAPAHTASNAVAKDISVGSSPLSMNAAILCSATVPVASDTMLNTATSRHRVADRNASPVVQDTSPTSSAPCASEPSAVRGTPPSGSIPMSSGCRRTNTAASGTMTPTPIAARAIQAMRHPISSIRNCVSGTNSIAPTGIPSDMNASARPRDRTNHFRTGTEVTSAPGPLIPTSPITANSATSCQARLMFARPTIAPPVASAATGSSARAPNLSSSGPITGLDSAPAPCRAVCAQPNAALPIPRSSPIGLMNRPKFSDPIAMLTAPDAPITATITHP